MLKRTPREEIYFQLIRWLNKQGHWGRTLFDCGDLGFALIYWMGSRWKVDWLEAQPIPSEVMCAGEEIRKERGTVNNYQKRKEKCLYEELKHVYLTLAPSDERTPEEKKRDAEQDKIDLFGPEENKEE